MNHKAWPHNLTDMDVCIMAGIPALGLGIRASYYDKNVYKGLGTAAPKVEIGKTFESVPKWQAEKTTVAAINAIKIKICFFIFSLSNKRTLTKRIVIFGLDSKILFPVYTLN